MVNMDKADVQKDFDHTPDEPFHRINGFNPPFSSNLCQALLEYFACSLDCGPEEVRRISKVLSVLCR